jgi:hypothetical protein
MPTGQVAAVVIILCCLVGSESLGTNFEAQRFQASAPMETDSEWQCV